MVSKTFVCLAILALVAVCSSAPSHNVNTQRRTFKQDQNQRISCPDLNSDNNSNESTQEPCDLTNQKQQQKQRNLQVQDTSAGDSVEEWAGKKMNVRLSQEDNTNSQEIHEAPKHQPMYQGRTGPNYMRGQQVRENIQKSRKGNGDTDSNENNSRAEQNQIKRKN